MCVLDVWTQNNTIEFDESASLSSEYSKENEILNRDYYSNGNEMCEYMRGMSDSENVLDRMENVSELKLLQKQERIASGVYVTEAMDNHNKGCHFCSRMFLMYGCVALLIS